MSELPETFVPGFHNEDAVRKMKYIKFGDTGMRVSHLSLGTATFSYLFGAYTFEQCKATVHEALKNGINYVDTAPYYGHGVSEDILGKCLEGIPRKAYYLATKVGRYEKEPKLMFDFSAKKTRESIDTSLKRLGVDYVDVLQVHDVEFAPSPKIVLEETLPTVKEAKDKGQTKFIGITGYHTDMLADLIDQSPVKIDTVLNYSRLSLLDNKLKEYIPLFKTKNLAIINAAPHCQALLTNNGPQPWQAAPQSTKDICTEARQYCQGKDVELGRLALYYALNEEGPHTVLVGMNDPKVLKNNLDVCFNGITQKEKEVYAYIQNNILSKLHRGHWEQIEIDNYLESLKASN